MEPLNWQQHAQLRVSHAPDMTRHFAQIVAAEFVEAMRDYPILFTKHPDSGGFYAGVVMGLKPGENGCCVDGRLPGYRPADLERQGFFLVDGQIVVEPQHAVFSDPAGKPLFDDAGEPSAALRRVQVALGTLQAGLEETDAAIARFLAHRLIEPIDIDLSFDDASRLRLEGLYTVSLDRLHALPDAAALDLFRRGDLQLAYAQAGSVGNLRRLARRYNERLT